LLRGILLRFNAARFAFALLSFLVVFFIAFFDFLIIIWSLYLIYYISFRYIRLLFVYLVLIFQILHFIKKNSLFGFFGRYKNFKLISQILKKKKATKNCCWLFGINIFNFNLMLKFGFGIIIENLPIFLF
jgi:hypothetical protein